MIGVRRALAAPWWPATVVLAVYGAFILLVLIANGGDPLFFVHATERSDGIHYYHAALDPLDGWQSVPLLYYQRILYPLLAWLLALGQANLVPWALVGINLLVVALLAYLLGAILHPAGRSRWWALVLLFHPGVFVPLYYDLTELVSLLLALFGLWLAGQNKLLAACITLLLAELARETALLFALVLLLYFALHRRWRLVAPVAAVTLGGYALWQALLTLLTGQVPELTSGLQYSLLPFQRALSDDLGAGRAAPWPFIIQLGIPAVGLALLALSARPLWRVAPLLILAQALFVAYLPWPTTTGFIHYDRNGLGLLLAGLLLGGNIVGDHGITGLSAAWKRQAAYALVLLSTLGGWLLVIIGAQGP